MPGASLAPGPGCSDQPHAQYVRAHAGCVAGHQGSAGALPCGLPNSTPGAKLLRLGGNLQSLCRAVHRVMDGIGHQSVELGPALPANAVFLVRPCMIPHDCRHASFCRDTRRNDLASRIIGILTLTPHDAGRRAPAVRLATLGTRVANRCGGPVVRSSFHDAAEGLDRHVAVPCPAPDRRDILAPRRRLVSAGRHHLRRIALRPGFVSRLDHGKHWRVSRHQLASRIPFCRLPEILRDEKIFAEARRPTLGENLRCARIALRDERSRSLTSFAEARRIATGSELRRA